MGIPFELFRNPEKPSQTYGKTRETGGKVTTDLRRPSTKPPERVEMSQPAAPSTPPMPADSASFAAAERARSTRLAARVRTRPERAREAVPSTRAAPNKTRHPPPIAALRGRRGRRPKWRADRFAAAPRVHSTQRAHASASRTPGSRDRARRAPTRHRAPRIVCKTETHST